MPAHCGGSCLSAPPPHRDSGTHISSTGRLGHLPRVDPLRRVIFTPAKLGGPRGGGFRLGGMCLPPSLCPRAAGYCGPVRAPGTLKEAAWLCEAAGVGEWVLLSPQDKGLTLPRECIFKVTVCIVMLFHSFTDLHPDCPLEMQFS